MKWAILGCAGVPAAYGGFETLAENLVLYWERQELGGELTVVCSGTGAEQTPSVFHGARLTYLPVSANGVMSIFYDMASLLMAAWRRTDTVLLLGVSGAIALPLVRCFTRMRVVTNIDGIEWRRAKWTGLARRFLQMSEWMAVRFSHVVVADNQGVADHVRDFYGRPSEVIAYGGDHAMVEDASTFGTELPRRYALALCRIEPENNVEMILGAFEHTPEWPLVFVGNWDASEFGRAMRRRYQHCAHLSLADPEYDLAKLKTLRANASLYVHGHSAGGTNPSLVEAMHFGLPVVAFDCSFNRYTSFGQAQYFGSQDALVQVVRSFDTESFSEQGLRLQALAREHYTWTQIGAQYFRVLAKCNAHGT
jgi:glycosyltransferase involved in cell wall biosynthesis